MTNLRRMYEIAEQVVRSCTTAEKVKTALCKTGDENVAGSYGQKPPERSDEHRTWTYYGWGGYPYADDGYDFDALLPQPPWRCIPELGSWPYVMCWWLAADDEYAMLARIEGDLILEVADDLAAAQAMKQRWNEAYPCDC